jgi:hypothetical protein
MVILNWPCHRGPRRIGQSVCRYSHDLVAALAAPLATSVGNSTAKDVSAYRRRTKPPHEGTLAGSNRMLSARDVADMLGIPECTVRDKWRDWGLPHTDRQTSALERVTCSPGSKPTAQHNTDLANPGGVLY